MNIKNGFTLIELMVVLAVIAVMTAIAMPLYQYEMRKLDASAVQQEMLKLADQLERYKSRNFSYHGFDPKYLYDEVNPMSSVNFPLKGTKKYTINLYDSSEATGKKLLSSDSGLGQRWAIIALSESEKNYSFLFTSTGLRCKNKTKANINFTGCGAVNTGMETW
ncbi:type IV pilin protein [Acinetobacter faecalis]|uniref:type IV pilin protein n=1 Tax=Acinetobacter faecalis TaxID=2665161 RepID=UPI002A919677|nr:prepilin-type N-terminal cleavage/methylation domain-containing protein [Acinetobacter faecalis]MDY6449381.1 prepilin-type N-terminal cleavage/methylation domain-containing protein [Acinetobacter faecalis]MDY6462732.1 prepilin-type N-terminal cleavage/methylation domain-containing protein [Acinetobacter faecalis]MDY6489485.1 prepilin-type N-terminal cleavage/methylation domain-containing protein [Acinetobacter faecalis]MDY6509783.1 prepilin-type N-terminal cleavage/methylation domain-contain